MRFPGKGRDSVADDMRKAVVTALVSALDDSRQAAKEKKGLTAVRAVATGATLVTVGRAAYKGGRFVRDRLRSDEEEPEAREDEELEEEEPEAEAEEDFEDEELEAEEEEEPEAEAEEDFEEEEPEAEEDEQPEAEEEEEPEAEAEEDFEDEEPEAEAEEEPEAEAEEDFEEEEPEAEEGEEPEAEEGEEPEAEARPSDVEEGRPPIFDRPGTRRRRARSSGSEAKRSGGEGPSGLEPPPRPSRSRAPIGRS
jgi:hypothetical protein